MSHSQIFHHRLLETVAWCATHQLWIPTLQPAGFEECGKMLSQTDEKRIEVVNTLAQRRFQLLKAQNVDRAHFADEINQGGIVAFSPDMSLWDGAAEAASEGFFDWSNTPAWDTWIMFVEESKNHRNGSREWQSYLLAWVSPQHLELANEGICVNPEACIDWIHHIPAPFVRELLSLQNGK